MAYMDSRGWDALTPLMYSYINNRETAAFGDISLAAPGVPSAPPLGRLRHPFEKPPPWAAFLLKIKFGAPQMVLKLSQDHKDSEYVLSFEIGQRESGFYSGRTNTQTDRITQPSRTY